MIKIEINNFGPISKGSIRIGGLTVFAGANNTGKSFATRLAYSILNSIQSDLHFEYTSHLLSSMNRPIILYQLDEYARQKEIQNRGIAENVNSIYEIIAKLNSIATTLNPKEIATNEFSERLKCMRFDLARHVDALTLHEITERSNVSISFLDSYLEHLSKIQDIVSKKAIYANSVHAQLKANIEFELTNNFQLSSLADLCGPEKPSPTIRFFGSNTDISFALEQSGADEQVKLLVANVGQHYPSNIFLESPIYWKLGDEVFHKRYLGSFTHVDPSNPRQPISGIPEYVASVRSKLFFDYTGEIAFPEILEWIKGKAVLNGSLTMSKGGQLRYNDGNFQYPIQATSTGIANIGVIGLLIERKLIHERTILFIDEPETNLHTAWQVLMAQLLLKLAQAGVSVIIATHSVDILKFIEVSANNDPRIIDLIQLHHFPYLNDDELDFFDSLRKIQDELSDPYYRLYVGRI